MEFCEFVCLCERERFLLWIRTRKEKAIRRWKLRASSITGFSRINLSNLYDLWMRKLHFGHPSNEDGGGCGWAWNSLIRNEQLSSKIIQSNPCFCFICTNFGLPTFNLVWTWANNEDHYNHPANERFHCNREMCLGTIAGGDRPGYQDHWKCV